MVGKKKASLYHQHEQARMPRRMRQLGLFFLFSPHSRSPHDIGNHDLFRACIEGSEEACSTACLAISIDAVPDGAVKAGQEAWPQQIQLLMGCKDSQG
jgi:hypothetical protein